MSKLTIRARIILFVALIGVSFSVFMSLFFPARALRMGNRLLGDSAVTLSSVFAGNIEAGFGALGFGGEEIINTAIKQLGATAATDGADATKPAPGGATDGAQGAAAPAPAKDADAAKATAA